MRREEEAPAEDNPVDYHTAGVFECHYVNGTQRVRYLERYFYNQEEYVYFDSDVGKFIAKTELGKPDADGWNSNKDIIDDARSAVETYCIHNYGWLEAMGAAGRKVQPEVVVSVMPHENTSTVHHILQCFVFGFYPSKVMVKWYRNGQEETEQVKSSALFQDGDWTFQILVMLETEIHKGDTFTCEVHHSSLGAPHRVHWKPQQSDADKSKMATGIVGFVLGAVFLIAGGVMYLRGKKGKSAFEEPQLGLLTDVFDILQTLPIQMIMLERDGSGMFDFSCPTLLFS
ncbi:H-2 class II histocompatibility antigen, E-S beta chain-like [Dendropsophus ebraccatus]|uniref:H-2 class II histocompatibility antigen, E-S beta chain-like n=1 Tax=Dendropsophus ebraccatus TaxID=150705 RepID=UPI0038317032